MRWVEVVFRPEDTRRYTYAVDPLLGVSIGDRVLVPGRKEGTSQTVTVVSHLDVAPPYACKHVLGPAPAQVEGPDL